MNFQQLRIIREAARRDYNPDRRGLMPLYLPVRGQPPHRAGGGAGHRLFIRYGKRLLGMTEPGKELLVIAERILGMPTTSANWRALSPTAIRGRLLIATTHTQARYACRGGKGVSGSSSPGAAGAAPGEPGGR